MLFALTVATTTVAGADYYSSFLSEFAQRDLTLSVTGLLLGGLWYSLTIIAILGCHELGHYLACRYYDVDASLPFFIPMPLLITGTMGAFIRIREPIPSKRMLFDIGIAGPIAGFLVTIPALFLGVAMSNVVAQPDLSTPGMFWIEFGEPLLMQLMLGLYWGTPPEGFAINLHPIGHAAWFGLLATALNLVPIAQLDGGHISYAVFGRRSTYVTFASLAATAGLISLSATWIGWTVLIVLMLVIFGPHHPRVFDETVPLDRTRMWLAAAAVAIFALSFTPAPIRFIDAIRS
jgi:membrane-associated protease RseP (regulator of RpoE activity)